MHKPLGRSGEWGVDKIYEGLDVPRTCFHRSHLVVLRVSYGYLLRRLWVFLSLLCPMATGAH